MSKEALDIPDKKNIPKTAKGRIEELMSLPLNQKVHFLPSSGQRFKMGPYIFRVKVVHPGKLRFTAALDDVVIDGINDGSEKISPIIDPITGKGAVKG